METKAAVKEIEKEFRVGRRVLARLADIGVIERLDFFDNCFKWIDIFLVGRFHTQHDVSVHLYETAI